MAFLMTQGAKRLIKCVFFEESNSLGSAPKTRGVGTRLPGTIEPLVVFTAICEALKLSMSGESSFILLNALCSGTWYFSTTIIELKLSAGIEFVLMGRC